jgi:hypothetical protein
MASFEADHRLYLTTLRAIAVKIAVDNGTVCVDDVRRHMQAEHFPMPVELGITERIFGRLLAGCADLEPVDRIVSTRAERLARSGPGASYISVYRLRARQRHALKGAA